MARINSVDEGGGGVDDGSGGGSGGGGKVKQVQLGAIIFVAFFIGLLIGSC